MFSSINWEIFITTCALLIGGYYFITTLLLFHKEIIHWVKSKGQSSTESEIPKDDNEVRVDMVERRNQVQIIIKQNTHL